MLACRLPHSSAWQSNGKPTDSQVLSYDIPSEAHGIFWLPSAGSGRLTVQYDKCFLHFIPLCLHMTTFNSTRVSKKHFSSGHPKASKTQLPLFGYFPQNLSNCFEHASIHCHLKHKEIWPRGKIKVMSIWFLPFFSPFWWNVYSFSSSLVVSSLILHPEFLLPLRTSCLRHYLFLNYWFSW